ncbi:MAG: hypothetical protein H6551_09315 [Chitinophagales bacterium]|nr:hypothetical protein [Chitinophagaceae bacterium]MCB9065321.1 hypothetical protein [Chitinophagales bacterium]
MPNGAEVPVATANGYISDYLTDYYATGKAPTKSMIMDADLLRGYLNNNTNIENVKFMLGVRTISVGGVDEEVFTLIVAGYDSSGNYVLSSTSPDMILDQLAPCPDECPTVGNAANDYIS